ncbi:MAG TPA: P-loop NTPase, partial [Rhodothermales bacterium]|nr:P-loop NTPase [Rhodothermales bacterium]
MDKRLVAGLDSMQNQNGDRNGNGVSRSRATSNTVSDNLSYRKSIVYDRQRQLRAEPRRNGYGGHPGYQPYPGMQPVSLREQVELALDLLYRRKWIVLLVFLVAVAGAVAYTQRQVTYYQATSYIMVDLATNPYYGQGQSSPSVGPPTTNLFAQADRPVSEELLVLQISSPLATRVAKRLEEMKVRADGKPISLLRTSRGVRSTEALANVLKGRVSFAPERGSMNIVRVSATSMEPREAILLANVFAEEYQKMTQEAGQERLSNVQAFLEQQEEQRRQELDRVEAQMDASNLDAGGLADGDRELVAKMAALQAERDNTRLDLQLKTSELRELESEINRQSLRVPDQLVSNPQQVVQDLTDKISDLKKHKDDIEQRYAPGQRSPVVQRELTRTDSLIAGLEAQLRRSSEALLSSASAVDGQSPVAYIVSLKQKADQAREEIKRMNATLALVEKQLASVQEDYARIPGQSMRLAELARSRDYAQQAYKYVADRLFEMRITGASQQSGGYVRLLQQAEWASQSADNRLRNLILGAFLGLLVGLGLAVSVDKLDNRIYKPDQVTGAGPMPLGVIPDMTKAIRKSYGRQKTIDVNGVQVSTSLMPALKPASPVAETYRPIRINLEHALPGKVIRTILVTSASPGEGKSVSAANLAITMAKGGRRVLLVDADLRRPRIAELLGLDRKSGLMQVLRGEVSLDSQNLSTDIEGLDVLTAGGSSNTVSDLFGGDRLEQFLCEAQ